MANVLPRDRQLEVISLLAEGVSLRSIQRHTGVRMNTTCKLLVRFGHACRELLDSEMRGLKLRHVQADEIWTFVGTKQGNLPVDQRDRFDLGDQYVWVAFDEDTKLVASYAVGKRSADMARRFMMDLASRLVRPQPHASDAHAFGAEGFQPIVQLSTDAFAGYREAVDLAFGPYATYGQLIKSYRNADQPGRYAPGEIISTDRNVIRGGIDPLDICTSHVERNNLTMRTLMKRFNRLTLGFSKKLDNLAAAVAIHFARHNFCWRTRRPGTSGRYRVTPAMKVGITDRLWSIEDLYDRAMGV